MERQKQLELQQPSQWKSRSQAARQAGVEIRELPEPTVPTQKHPWQRQVPGC